MEYNEEFKTSEEDIEVESRLSELISYMRMNSNEINVERAYFLFVRHSELLRIALEDNGVTTKQRLHELIGKAVDSAKEDLEKVKSN